MSDQYVPIGANVTVTDYRGRIPSGLKGLMHIGDRFAATVTKRRGDRYTVVDTWGYTFTMDRCDFMYRALDS